MQDPYEVVDYNTLSLDQRQAIDSLNLEQLLRDELVADEPDFAVVRFALRRLSQFGNASVLDDVLGSLDVVHPVLPDICRYIVGLQTLDDDARVRLGTRMLNLLTDSVVSELPYHRMWILDLFAQSNAWGNSDRFFTLFASEQHAACQRNLILAMGRSRMRHWFQSQWRSLFDYSHWPRRAVLLGMSCLAPDARRHRYASVKPQLDSLELAITKWAMSDPI